MRLVRPTRLARPTRRPRPIERTSARAAALTVLAFALAGIGAVAWPTDRAAADTPAPTAPVAAVEAVPPEGTVGDRFAFRFTVDLPAGWTVVWPDLGRTFGPFEVVGVSRDGLVPGADDGVAPGEAGAAESPTSSAGLRATRVVTATAFTTGTLSTPTLTLTAVDVAGAAHAVTVSSIDVTIRSVLTAANAEPAGPRGPVALPVPSQWPLLAGGLSAVAALLAVLLWALRRMIAQRRRGAESVAADSDTRTALDIARADLDALARADLPGRGHIVEHYTRMADALRAFVERSFHVPALERTTAELQGAFGPMGVRDPEVEPLLAVLGDADLVKFAGIVPDAPTARASLADAQALIGPLWGAAERRRIAAEAAVAAITGASAAQADDRTASTEVDSASADADAEWAEDDAEPAVDVVVPADHSDDSTMGDAAPAEPARGTADDEDAR